MKYEDWKKENWGELQRGFVTEYADAYDYYCRYYYDEVTKE